MCKISDIEVFYLFSLPLEIKDTKGNLGFKNYLFLCAQKCSIEAKVVTNETATKAKKYFNIFYLHTKFSPKSVAICFVIILILFVSHIVVLIVHYEGLSVWKTRDPSFLFLLPILIQVKTRTQG